MKTELLSMAGEHWIVVTTRTPAPGARSCDDAVGAQLLPDGGCTLAVADGVGGGARGDVCSAAAIMHALDASGGTLPVAQRAHRVFSSADAVVHKALRVHTSARGATTLVGAWLDPSGRACVAHCGDSRAYIARAGSGRLLCLTRDHNYRNLGLPAPASGSADDPARMLGLGTCGGSDACELEINAGDLVLLCTDGVHAHVPARWLSRKVAGMATSLRSLDAGAAEGKLLRLAGCLVAHARLRCGRDDASIALAWKRHVSEHSGEWRRSCRTS